MTSMRTHPRPLCAARLSREARGFEPISAPVGHPQHRASESRSAADAICHERLKPPPLDRYVVIDGRHLACRREELPLPRYALEHEGAPVYEGDARAVNEVLHGARHQNLARLGQCGNSGANVHRDATYVFTADLTLAGVQTTSHIDAQFRHPLGDRGRTPKGPRRAIECREKTVAGVLYDAPLKTGDFGMGDFVVAR